jgi:hypothetical protein
VTFGLGVATLYSALPAHAAVQPRVALIELAPADTGIPYSPLPRATEMSAMRARLRFPCGFARLLADRDRRDGASEPAKRATCWR